MPKVKIFLLLFAVLAIIAGFYFLKKRPPPPAPASPAPVLKAAATCDPSLWKYIWYPARLEIRQDCKTVEGTIEKKFLSEDGDYHLLLAPDHLVIEIICAGPSESKTAQKACAGYENKVLVPEVGDRVSVTGTFVLDKTHNWNEIHPVSHLDIVPQRATIP